MQIDEIDVSALRVERVFQGWSSLDVLHVTQQFKGREVSFTREVHDHGHGVAVLAYDLSRRVTWLVRQVRWASVVSGGPAKVLEVPAGLIDQPGTAEATARREAMEEIGVCLKELTFIAHAYSSPGAVTERIHLFLAEVEAPPAADAGGGLDEEHEDIEVVEVPLDQLFEMNSNGQLIDMKTIILVQALQHYLEI